MLTQAQSIAASEFPVFPCHPATKAPLTKNGFKDATTDPAQIGSWWERWPDARIGMPTGDIVALDIDAKHQPGLVADFDARAKDAGIDLTALAMQDTPTGGGRHYLFRQVHGNPHTPIRNRKLASNEAKETIIETRGKGGYICIYGDLDLSAIPTLSEAQIEALFDVAMSFDSRPVQEVKEPVRMPWERKQGLSPGDDYNQRGDVFTLLRKHGWRANSEHSWRRPGKDHGLSATWDKVPGKFFVFSTNAAPLDPDHAYSPFALYCFLEHDGDFEAAARGLREEGYGEADKPDPLARANAEAVIACHEARIQALEKTGEAKKEPKVIVREHADRLRDCRNPPPWLIDNVIGVGHLGCWVASPGVGKTLLAIETASAVASGEDFASHKVKAPGRVLYLCTDAPMSTERRMLALPEAAQGSVSSVAEFPALPGGIVELSEILESSKERPYRLVVLDTWDSTRDHSGGSWADQDGAIEMVMRGLRKLARHYQIAVLIIHHATREGSRTRGSGVFDARMDVIGLVEQKGGVVSMSLIKARDSEARVVGRWGIEAVDLWEDGNEIPRLVWQESVAESMPANHLAVLKAVNSGADSLSSIVQKSKVSKTTVHRAIEKLRQDGLIEMESYSLTPEGREVEEIRLQIMVEQVLRNGGFVQ